MKMAAAALLAIASLAVAATAHADCGDPGQDPCTGPVPTVDQVVSILQQLTDPNIPAASKGNIVTPGFDSDEAGTIDNHLTRMQAFGGLLPPDFVVTDIESAPADFAGATVATNGGYKHAIHLRPLVLVDQGGHWLVTHDTAMDVLSAIWAAGQKVYVYVK
jgi:hypothetical protein